MAKKDTPAYVAGVAAFCDGDKFNNPHLEGSKEAKQWIKGWDWGAKLAKKAVPKQKKQKKDKTTVCFIVYSSESECIVTTAKLEHVMLKACFGVHNNRLVGADREDKVPLEYRETNVSSTNNINLYDRQEIIGSEITLASRIDY